MSLRLNGSTSGYSEIVAPAVAGDQTFTLPTTGGNVLTNVSDLEAQVKTATNATGSAPVYSCRAWVNFNGTGTVAIRDSGNVSSITDNGTGDYTVNFTTAMPDANYAIDLSVSFSTTGGDQPCSYPSTNTAPTSSAVRVNVLQGGPVNGAYFVNNSRISVVIFR